MANIKKILLKIIKEIHKKVLCRKEFYNLNLFIYKVSLHGIGVLNYESMSGETSFLNGALSGIENPVVLDVGANIGDYTNKVLDVNPGSKVVAFEPHPGNFAELKNKFNKDNVVTVQKACGKNCSNVKLFDYSKDNSSHASTVEGVIENVHGSSSKTVIDVKMTTIDKFVSESKIDEVDLLKIDTEGNELDVLKGAKNLIENGKVRCIQFEFNEMNVESRTFALDFVRYLSNYDIYRVLPNGLVRLGEYNAVEHEIFAYQNLIAVLSRDSDIKNRVT